MAEGRVAVPAIGVVGKKHLEPAYFCRLVSEHKTKASKHSDQTGGDVDKHNKMFLWRLFFPFYAAWVKMFLEDESKAETGLISFISNVFCIFISFYHLLPFYFTSLAKQLKTKPTTAKRLSV